jgi:tRNA 2-selenouridine synthase
VIIGIHDFLRLREELATVDVRSEGEFKEGHIAGAVNIPILNNQERIQVGTDYKQKGQLEAIKTGFRLVGPRILDIVNEAEKAANNKELLIHCWRGGMRSTNFCQFVEMAKIKTHQLGGGYKTYRHTALASFRDPLKLIVLGGSTGSGKSEILRSLAAKGEQVIDLEKLAHHKGSVFGGLMMPPQPTTEQFQNDLFEAIRKLDHNKRIWIEDESIAVGKIFIPDDFWRQMTSSSVIEIEVGKTVRIERLVAEYGHADRDEFLEAMTRIVKKLGGQHFNAAREKLKEGDMAAVIEILLTYYDKAYFNGLDKKKKRIRSQIPWDGKDPSEFAAYLMDQRI